MTLKSMTGFARAEGRLGSTSWQWEVRSVNGRGLDVRLRLPSGYEEQESAIRKMVTARLGRGNVSVNLQIKSEGGASQIQVNEQVLEQMLAAMKVIGARTTLAPPSAAELLNMKGVLETCEVAESEQIAAQRIAAIMASLQQAISAIADMRAAEGAHLEREIAAQINEVEVLVAQIAASPVRTRAAIQERLTQNVARIISETSTLDENRLYLEAAILATKLDVEEELKRLSAHIAAARELLDCNEPVGRRFDFLAQEFNREANTLCSKSNDTAITRSGLAMKAVIDQLREQVQNIE